MSDDEQDVVDVQAEPVSKQQAREAGDMNRVTDEFGDVEVSMSKSNLASAMKAIEAGAQGDVAALKQKCEGLAFFG